MTLVDLWFVLLGFVLFMHLGLGSIDLGLCLFSLFVDAEKAESMLASVDSVWHTNQTWLVVLGAVLFGAFPKIYGAVLSTRYGLVVLLLLALGLRGLGMEYRHRAKRSVFWLRLAGWGGTAVLVAEGILLWNIVLGGNVSSAWFGLQSLVQPRYFSAVLLLLSSGLLMGGSWWLTSSDRSGADRNVRIIVQISGVFVVLSGLFCCFQLMQTGEIELPLVWRPFLVLTVLVMADLTILFASLRPSWQGSPLPWGLALTGLVLTACGVLIYVKTGPTLSELASGDLTFLTIAMCVLLPPLLAFQIFQYRLERRGQEPVWKVPAPASNAKVGISFAQLTEVLNTMIQGALGLFQGYAETFKAMFTRPITVQYPEERRTPPPRSRAHIVLTRSPDGDERCVACYLCSAACPVSCISMQADTRADGRRYAAWFRINFARCIYCGLCEEACPTLAIQLTPEYEFASDSILNLVAEKEDLLVDHGGKDMDYDFYSHAGVEEKYPQNEHDGEEPPVNFKSNLP